MSRHLSTAPDDGVNVGEAQALSLNKETNDPLSLEMAAAVKTTAKKTTKKTETTETE